MCGIFATITDNASIKIYEALKKLEYRGYDSAGIATVNKNNISLVKRAGRIENLKGVLSELNGNVGIGHTRWATHGWATDKNAHPHMTKRFALVHNGIIENYQSLMRKDEVFSSETDTEVALRRIEEEGGEGIGKLINACKKFKGTYAFAMIERGKERVYLAKMHSPLVVGYSDGIVACSSDITAMKGICEKIYPLEDGEFCILEKNSIKIYNDNNEIIERTFVEIDDEIEERGFVEGKEMFIEITQNPSVYQKATEVIENGLINKVISKITSANRIHFVACGTAYHACLLGEYFLRDMCSIDSRVYYASEYRYLRNAVKKGDLVIALSQSGETIDTLFAIKQAISAHANTIAITNTPYSSIDRAVELSIHTNSGVERGVAATKSFISQVSVIYHIAAKIAGISTTFDIKQFNDEIENLKLQIDRLSKRYSSLENIFYIGRGVDYPLSLEGSLKLKEVSYIASEGYAAGEIKHGTLSLITPITLTIASITERRFIEKTMNAVHEIKSRGGKVLIITPFENEIYGLNKNEILSTQDYGSYLNILPVATAHQLFAYYIAIERGNNPDKPRNLAKSVTVE